MKYFYVLASIGDRNIASGLRANFFSHSPILPKLSHSAGIYAMRNTRPSDYDNKKPDSQLVKNGQASDLDSIWRRIRQCVKQFGPIVPCIYKERDSLWRNEQISLIWINYLIMLLYVKEASNTFHHNYRVPHGVNALSHWYLCKCRKQVFLHNCILNQWS